MKDADLHVHSNRSDGSDPPARVVERAAEAGLAAIALTDHDTTAGLEEALDAGRRLGVEVVPGIELSAQHGDREVHLLAYFVRQDDPDLLGVLTRMETERGLRAERIVARLNAHGIPVTIEAVRSFAGGRSIGRPHVADALVQGGFVPSYDRAWRDYLRPRGLAYVDRSRLELGEAISLIRASGGVTSIAHPTLNLDLPTLESLASCGVHGLETTHPRLRAEDSAALSDLCRRSGWIETGGSDCHGSRRGPPTMGPYRVPLTTLETLRHAARAAS